MKMYLYLGHTFLYIHNASSKISLKFIMAGYTTQQLVFASKQILLPKTATASQWAFTIEFHADTYCSFHKCYPSMCQELSGHWQHFTSKVNERPPTYCSNRTKHLSSQGYCWNGSQCFSKVWGTTIRNQLWFC